MINKYTNCIFLFPWAYDIIFLHKVITSTRRTNFRENIIALSRIRFRGRFEVQTVIPLNSIAFI